MTFVVREQTWPMSSRKLLFHILLHEIRHWAQIALAVRLAGFEPPGDHDFLLARDALIGHDSHSHDCTAPRLNRAGAKKRRARRATKPVWAFHVLRLFAAFVTRPSARRSSTAAVVRRQ